MKTAFVLLLLAGSAVAAPLDCQSERQPSDSLAWAVKKADIVFLGRLQSFHYFEEKGTTNVTLKPEVRWKGAGDELMTFTLPSKSPCDIGRDAEKNSEWLIVADKDGKILTRGHTHRCWNLVEEQAMRTAIRSVLGDGKTD